jgi:hypothetical protein
MTAVRSFHVLAIAALLSSGCATVPTGQFEALRDASQTLATHTTQTYARLERLQWDELTMRAFGEEKLSNDSFRAVRDGRDFSLTKRLEKREAAIDAVARYTQVLAALAGPAPESDVDRKLQELAGALQRMVAANDGTAETVNIPIIVVDALSHAATASIRRNGLREAMDAAGPGIKSLSDYFAQDQERLRQFIEVMRLRLFAFSAAARPPAELGLERHQFDRIVGLMSQELDQVDRALIELKTAAEAIPPAHDTLRVALDKKEVSRDSLRKLIAETQRLNKFYRALPAQ